MIPFIPFFGKGSMTPVLVGMNYYNARQSGSGQVSAPAAMRVGDLTMFYTNNNQQSPPPGTGYQRASGGGGDAYWKLATASDLNGSVRATTNAVAWLAYRNVPAAYQVDGSNGFNKAPNSLGPFFAKDSASGGAGGNPAAGNVRVNDPQLGGLIVFDFITPASFVNQTIYYNGNVAAVEFRRS